MPHSDAEFWLLRGNAESPDPADRGQGSVASAIRFYQNLLAERGALGYGGFDNTLRPGFAEPRPGESDYVGVYRRVPGG